MVFFNGAFIRVVIPFPYSPLKNGRKRYCTKVPPVQNDVLLHLIETPHFVIPASLIPETPNNESIECIGKNL